MPSTSTSAKPAQTGRKTRAKTPRVSPEQRRQMIEESAYFRAESRSFQGGDPVADWLLSEQEVDELLSKGAH